MNKLFVFDLDDTLIDNVHDYAEPILDACRFVVKTLKNKAPHVSKIIAIEQEIDKRRVKEINPSTGKPYLWSMERFPGSLVETYREICRQSKVEPTKTAEEHLYDIGLRAFDETMYGENINPWALSVLDFLRKQGDALLLCTKGDLRVQEKKIATLQNAGINHFTTIRIVDDKTPKIFEEMAYGFGHCGLFSVGNSYSSDIRPALEAGFRGIYIPVETWETIGKMDSVLSEVDRENCVVLQNLSELKTQYGRLA
jgi:FMN phosphatase YigB (HAD superfamily)